MLSPAEQACTTFRLPRLVQVIRSACLALEHPLSNQFRHFFVHFSSNSIDFLTFHACMHLFLGTITHPLIPIGFLLSSIDFHICPMPLGQQSITPLVFHQIPLGFCLSTPNPSIHPSVWSANPPTLQLQSIWQPTHPYLSLIPPLCSCTPPCPHLFFWTPAKSTHTPSPPPSICPSLRCMRDNGPMCYPP